MKSPPNYLLTDPPDIRYAPYRCPWQSIHLISADVPNSLRMDFFASSYGLTKVDLLKATNRLKLRYMERYAKRPMVRPEVHLDPGKLKYDGWNVTQHDTFTHMGSDVRPFKYGFVVATKQVRDYDLYAVSIGLMIRATI